MPVTVHTELGDIIINDHCDGQSCGSTDSTGAPSEIGSTYSSSPRPEHKLEDVALEACGALARQAPPAMSAEVADEPLQDMFADSDDDGASPTSPSKSARRRLRRRRQRDALRAAAEGRAMKLSSQAEGPCSPAAALGKLGFDFDVNVQRSSVPDTSSAPFAMDVPSLYKAPIVAQNSLTSTPVRAAVMSTCPNSPGSVASPSADASMRSVPPKTPMSTCPCSNTSLKSPSADASTRPVPLRTLVNGSSGGNPTPLGAASLCMEAFSPIAPITPPNAANPVALDRTVTPMIGEPSSTPVRNNGRPNKTDSPLPEMLKMLAGVAHMPTWGEIAYKLQTAAPEVYED